MGRVFTDELHHPVTCVQGERTNRVVVRAGQGCRARGRVQQRAPRLPLLCESTLHSLGLKEQRRVCLAPSGARLPVSRRALVPQ